MQSYLQQDRVAPRLSDPSNYENLFPCSIAHFWYNYLNVITEFYHQNIADKFPALHLKF